MARSGILYSDLANAAARLVAEGKNPTVDSVRVALGSTGSKSTIAPLLKRWKAEHQEAVVDVVQGLGLPGPLLQAMKHLHDKLQDDVQLQLAQAQEAHHVALLSAHEATQQVENEKRVLDEHKVALSTELAQVKNSQEQLNLQYQTLCVRQAALQAEQDGAQQRLADRAIEVAALNSQLTQARTQFDHYLDAAAEQRTQERQAAEQQVNRLERELADLRQQQLLQHSAIVQYEARIPQMQNENSQLVESLQAAKKNGATWRSERDQLAFQLSIVTAERTLLHQKLAETQEAVTAVRIALAAQAGQTEQMAGQITRNERHIAELDQQRLNLVEERAALQVRVMYSERLEQSPQASPPGDVQKE